SVFHNCTVGCRTPADRMVKIGNWNYRVTTAEPAEPTRGHVSELRLMAVHAHPDDESSKGAASMARYADEGARVLVVTLTGGERGYFLNPATLHDGCLGTVPLEEPVEELVRLVRKFRPHVMTTYDENGGYPHPDHIRTHQVSVGAYEAAGDHLLFPDAGEPWEVLKLYYNHGFLRRRMQLLQDEFAKHGRHGPFEKWLKHWDPEHDPFAGRVTTRVECYKYFAQRDDALRAHATQIDPEGDFFQAPIEWQQRLWPTEEYELARSRVPVS